MKRRSLIARSIPLVAAGGILSLMGGTLWFLYEKSRPRAAEIVTESPFVADIQKKSIASGAIQPRQEVEIKPRVSGILHVLHLKAGDKVKVGDLIGEVRIIPDPIGLNDAELRLRTSELREQRSKREMDRIDALAGRGTVPAADLDSARTEYELSKEEVETARSRVQLMRSGALKQSKGASTQIESTVAGTVLSIPIKVGSSVINSNSFNPGTTVAFVADMTDMIFKGTIDESEVGKLKVGMPVEIVIGALNDLTFAGKLEFVAPKSVAKEGTTEFEIEAAFRAPEDLMVRAGYSANVNIVLAERKQVMAVNESVVTFENGKAYADVKTGSKGGEDLFERRPIKVGLSDGIRVEVLDGLKKEDVLRKPQLLDAPPEGGPRRPPGRR